jgi:hypothetical protein
MQDRLQLYGAYLRSAIFSIAIDTQTWKASEMRVAIAGTNFDPASLE